MAREWDFATRNTPTSENPGGAANPRSDVRYWEYEKGDFSIRLDPEAGPFEQILLVATLRAGADMADHRAGRQLVGRTSAAAKSGANLSGANLSGREPQRRESSQPLERAKWLGAHSG